MLYKGLGYPNKLFFWLCSETLKMCTKDPELILFPSWRRRLPGGQGQTELVSGLQAEEVFPGQDGPCSCPGREGAQEERRDNMQALETSRPPRTEERGGVLSLSLADKDQYSYFLYSTQSGENTFEPSCTHHILFYTRILTWTGGCQSRAAQSCCC